MTASFARDLDTFLASHRYRGVPRRTRTMIRTALDAGDTRTLAELLPHVIAIMLTTDTTNQRTTSARPSTPGGGA